MRKHCLSVSSFNTKSSLKCLSLMINLFGKAVRARLTLILQYSSLFNQFYPQLRHIYWRVLPKSLTGDVNPISPSTPGNKAAILLLFTELRKLEIELFNENCCFKCSVKYLNDWILTLIRRYPAAHMTTPTTARISIMVTAAGCLIKTNKVRVKSR